MTARLTVATAAHPPTLSQYFPATQLDCFHQQAVLHTLFADCWYSVLIEDGTNAWAHTFAPSAIGQTGCFDIEPWLGYSGPLTNTTEATFIANALTQYSEFCRAKRIVAELIRFDPLARNHEALAGHAATLRIIEEKPIIYIQVQADENAQLAGYSPSSRRMVTVGKPTLTFRPMDPLTTDWNKFLDIYLPSTDRVGADPKWRFDPAFFERMRSLPCCSLWGVFSPDDQLVSTAIMLCGTNVAYYFLAANGDMSVHKGASNILVHGLTRVLAQRGVPWLCLGGGNTMAPDDPLLFFKRKFSNDTRKFPLGFFAHDADALSSLYRKAEDENAAIRDSRMFLRYREASSLAPGRMTPATL
jgi:hypothetical protein